MLKREFENDAAEWIKNMEAKKKRRSRWAQDDTKTFIPGMPTMVPGSLSKEQEEQYIVHLQIEEISRRLRTGDLGIPPNPEERSPSPEPIYNNEGKRLNTREYRTRKKLEEERHMLVQKAADLNDDYKPPADYKPPVIRVNDKVMIPQEEHPDINFVGLLIGPRGNTLKNLEKDTGAKIIIRGKGSVKEGKIGRKDGQPLPGEDEPLHAYITANNAENVKKATEKIKEIIRQGIEVPEGQNDLRRQQLRELALLNGTLRENDGLAKLKQLQQAQTIFTNTCICTVCGGAGHLAQDCKQKRPGDTLRELQQQQQTPTPVITPVDKAKMDSEYMSLMAELGEAPPPVPVRQPLQVPFPQHTRNQSSWQNNQQRPTRLGRMSLPPPSSIGLPPPLALGPPPTSIGPPPMTTAGPPPVGPPPVSLPPWQQSQSINNSHSSTRPQMLAPPPPPPPPNSQQPPTSFNWQTTQQTTSVTRTGSIPPPWATTAPRQNLPPWQQQQSPFPSMAPPPPPPGNFHLMNPHSAAANFNPTAPPPPPPSTLQSGIPIGVPPPPPPN